MKQKRPFKKLIPADYLILFALILMIATHSFTQFLVNKHMTTTQTQEDARALLQFVELNPLGALFLQFSKLKYIYSYFFAPAVFIGFWYYLRKRYWDKQDMLYMNAIIIFTFLLLNFFNDISALLWKTSKGDTLNIQLRQSQTAAAGT